MFCSILVDTAKKLSQGVVQIYKLISTAKLSPGHYIGLMRNFVTSYGKIQMNFLANPMSPH